MGLLFLLGRVGDMKKALRWLFVVITALLALQMCSASQVDYSLPAILDSLLHTSAQTDRWVLGKESCAAIEDVHCRQDREFALSRFLAEQKLGNDRYVPIVPPRTSVVGGAVVFPEGSLEDWLTLRGMTATETRGVAVVLAVSPLSGTVPLASYPNIFFFPPPVVAMQACFQKYAQSVRDLTDPSQLRDFYAWRVIVNSPRLKWEYRDGGVRVSGVQNVQQPYLCVVYRAPVEKEVERLTRDGQVITDLPSYPMLGHLPGGLAQQIAVAINERCNQQLAQTLSNMAWTQVWENLWNILDGNWAASYRVSHGQLSAICSIAATARVVRGLPTPTPTPTATPTPTVTPTPSRYIPSSYLTPTPVR